MKSRGFTLIELLVVVAIISLLSSIVLASLNSARVKARNTQRIQAIGQYQKALELAQLQNGAYPSAADSPFSSSCLGTDPGTSYCWGNAAQSPTVTAALTPYISFATLPPIANCVAGWTCDYRQPLYSQHNRARVLDPTAFRILYYLEGVGRSCGPGEVFDGRTVWSDMNVTYCVLYSPL